MTAASQFVQSSDRLLPRRAIVAGAVAAVAVAVAVLLLADRREGALPGSPPITVTVTTEPPAAAVTPAPFALPAALVPGDVSGIVVHGTLRGGSGGSAIVSEGGGPQRRIAAGRPLRGDIVVEGVAADHIVVGRGGSRLRIPLARFGSAPGEAVAIETAPAETPASPAALSRADYAGAAAKRQTLAFKLGLAKVVAGPVVTGFRIRPGADLPLFDAAGLRAGDIVTAIDGNGLNDDEKITELANMLGTAKRLRIAYSRAGAPMETTVDFAD